MIEQGAIQDVQIRTVGSQALNTAVTGSTVVFVQDASDFDEAGGQLSITSLDPSTALDTNATYDYSSADLDLDTITLVQGLAFDLAVGDPVYVQPTAIEKYATVMLAETEEPVTAQVTHALVDLLPEGIRDADEQEQAVVELVNGQWWLTNLPGRDPSIQSQNYDESTGWRMDSETSQFQNANILGSVGADQVATNSLLVDGQDLFTDIIGSSPTGVISQAVLGNAATDTASVSAATMMVVFTASELKAGRVYKINYGTPVSGTVTNDVFLTRVYYTIDGTTPIIGGFGIMDGSICPIVTVAGQTLLGEHNYYYYPTADVDTLKLGFVLVRSAGTGTAKYVTTNANLPFYVSVEDAGAANLVTGTLSLKSKSTGGTADADPVATYTKTYWATDSQSYDQNGGKRLGDANTPYMYQGYYSGTHGRTFSLAYFNSTQIRSDLGGATIKSCKLTFRVAHAYYNSGVHVRVGMHGQDTPQSTQGEPSTVYGSRDNCTESSTYSVDLTVTFGNALRDGTARGIVFFSPGNNALTHYGYMYGATASTSRPRLVITYSK